MTFIWLNNKPPFCLLKRGANFHSPQIFIEVKMDLERITTLQAAWGHEQSDQIGLQSVQSPELKNMI